MRFLSFMLFFTLIMGCTTVPEEETTPIPTISSLATQPPPTIHPEQRLELENYQTQLRQAHLALAEIWESLAANGTAQCGQTYAIPSPSLFDNTNPIERDLGQASANLRQAADLWASECQLGRATVPPEVIQQAVLWVRGAGDALTQVEEALGS